MPDPPLTLGGRQKKNGRLTLYRVRPFVFLPEGIATALEADYGGAITLQAEPFGSSLITLPSALRM